MTDAVKTSNPTRQRRYSDSQIEAFAQQVLQEGFCILPQHFSTDLMDMWRSAFEPLLQERIAASKASARGPARYYISLPFTQPFADPTVYEDPDILAILELLTGDDIVMPELAVDTPLNGSDYQVIHRDITQRSADRPDGDPAQPFQFAVNFSLVDITPDNGPFEIVPGTHQLTDKAARAMVDSGEAEARLAPLLMTRGDVMIRDVRALHRGTPNRTDTPRPMVVVGYNCSWHQRPQLRIFIPQDAAAQLSERSRRLLKLNPVVPSLDDVVAEETYSNLYFLEDE